MAVYIGAMFPISELFSAEVIYDNSFIFDGKLISRQTVYESNKDDLPGCWVQLKYGSGDSETLYCDTKEEALWEAKSRHQSVDNRSNLKRPHTIYHKDYDPEKFKAKFGEESRAEREAGGCVILIAVSILMFLLLLCC